MTITMVNDNTLLFNINGKEIEAKLEQIQVNKIKQTFVASYITKDDGRNVIEDLPNEVLLFIERAYNKKTDKILYRIKDMEGLGFCEDVLYTKNELINYFWQLEECRSANKNDFTIDFIADNWFLEIMEVS